ncbi:MAG: class I SAM-dependent methyltransferase [Victivallales bacterium]|nr:class I SAM-dependent methyltransferase [Victivallales bacterium]
MADLQEVDLFKVPLKHRNYSNIAAEQKRTLSKFGKEYYDEPSMPGYRGYEYNGNWRNIARDIVNYYKLLNNAKILDVGCAKGFLLYDFYKINPTFELYGVDISEYAIKNAMPEIKNNLTVTSCTNLPYDNSKFDLVISTDTLHNLEEKGARKAVTEINRVGKIHKFIMVHSYRNDKERDNLINWEATIKTIRSVDEWKELYYQENYTGQYYWKIFI